METKQRTMLLESLCYLSFAGNTIRFLIFLLPALFFTKFSALILRLTSLDALDGITPVYFFILAVFSAVSFFGVYRLWKMKKDGLLFYFAGKAALLFMPVVWIGWQAFSIAGAGISLFFLTLFLTQILKFY